MTFILETAARDVSVCLAAIRNGAYDYLRTPFEREQLLNTVHRALEHRRLTLENRALKAELAKLQKKNSSIRSETRF